MAKSYSITSKHQVTLPQEVREELALKPSDQIVYKKEGKRYYIAKAPVVMSIQEVQAMNRRLLEERQISPVSDADIARARQKFYEQGGTW
jgi:AbrB family looped-hinge helix DNA binding protein